MELSEDFIESAKESIESFIEYISVSGVSEILRRYFVMNAFDGALTMLGFVMGSFMSGLKDPRIIISAGISASLAMGISGFVGALITEKAEREKKVKELERTLFLDLEGTIVDKASKIAIILAAIVDATAPALAALICSSPFILSLYNIVNFIEATFISVIITLLFIFLLGVYLGNLAEGNALKYGLYMIAAGISVSVIITLIGGW